MRRTQIAVGTLLVLAGSMLALPSHAVLSDCAPVARNEGPMALKQGLWNPVPALSQGEENPAVPFGSNDGITQSLADGAHFVYWDWYAGGGLENYYRVTGYYGSECDRMLDSFTNCMASYLDPILCSSELNLHDWLPMDILNCRGPKDSLACGAVEGDDCFTREVAAQGIANDPSTVWYFWAYTNYGPQSYNKTSTGSIFEAHTTFDIGWGPGIYVQAALYADDEIVGYWHYFRCE